MRAYAKMATGLYAIGHRRLATDQPRVQGSASEEFMAPQLYPDLEQLSKLKVPLNDAERCLLEFLHKNLGNEYEVYSQPFLNGDRPDFVVMRKGSGVLVIEVKDWNLDAYRNRGGKWTLKKNNASVDSPLKQVQSYRSHFYNWHIDDLLKKGLYNKGYFKIVNCAVYFHHHDEEMAQQFCGVSGRTQVLGRNSRDKTRLESLLGICHLDRTHFLFDSTLYECFRRHLKPPLHMLKDGKGIEYKPKQKALIESRPIEQKIRGVAGSGKTTVLAKRAVNACLRTGDRVLVLTYNIALRNYIHDKISDVRAEFDWKNFFITHYDLFFRIEANNYNLPVNDHKRDSSDTQFFAPVEKETVRYRAIFVDEIQDYETEWIRIIKEYFLIKEGGELVVFGDEKQNIYGRKPDKDKKPNTTIPGRWNELTDSFRSSSKIMSLAIEFQKHFFRDKYDLDIVEQGDLFGEAQNITYVDMANSASAEQLAEQLFERIHGTIERLNIPDGDVVVLSSKIEILRELDFLFQTKAHEKTATTFESKQDDERLNALADQTKAYWQRNQIRRNKKFGFWPEGGTVKLATIHSFKGWEAPTLFLIIEDEPLRRNFTDEEFALDEEFVSNEEFPSDEEFASNKEFPSDELIYTAITRCKKNLIIINLGIGKYREFFLKHMPAENVQWRNGDDSDEDGFL